MWRTRKTAPRPDPLTDAARTEARQALAEVRAMRGPTHARHGRLLRLGHVLDEIREENHFSSKIFGDP